MVEDHGVKRLVLSAPTSNDIRETMLEGESGLFNAYSPNDPNRPHHVVSQSAVKWPNGARALLVPYEALERSRGPNLGALWIDEVGSFGTQGEEFVENLLMALRLAPAQALFTTTPRATPLIIDLYNRQDQDVNLVVGTSFENEENLDEVMIKRAKAMMNTPLGRQEVLGELALSNAAALWSTQLVENSMRYESEFPPRTWKRAVIAIDPSANKPKSDITGICVAVEIDEEKVFVLKDLSSTFTSDGWTSLVGEVYDELSQFVPTVVVLEENGVGQTWEEILRKKRPDIPCKPFSSTKNKLARLGQTSMMFELGRVYMNKNHNFADMQKEMITYTGRTKEKSPDRTDAMSFACNELLYRKQNVTVTKELLF